MAIPQGKSISINNQEVKLIPLGYCACGCGGETTIAKDSCRSKNHKKGRPVLFIHGHNGGKGSNHFNWKGSHGVINGHRHLAEKALRKALPAGAEVHHHTPEQIVICQDHNYHMLLHQRQRALRECGKANWRRCNICKNWDDPENLIYTKANRSFSHRQCAKIKRRERYLKSKINQRQIQYRILEGGKGL